MDAKKIQFAICLSSDKDGDLKIFKIYPILPDYKAEAVGCLRVIDESGEDYLYPKSRFIIVPLPKEVIDRVYFQNLIKKYFNCCTLVPLLIIIAYILDCREASCV